MTRLEFDQNVDAAVTSKIVAKHLRNDVTSGEWKATLFENISNEEKR